MRKPTLFETIAMKVSGIRMYKVVIEWLDDENMFVAYSDDIDGLMIEAATFNEMVASLQDMVPILLEENGQVSHAQSDTSLDFDFRIKSPLSNLSRSAVSA